MPLENAVGNLQLCLGRGGKGVKRILHAKGAVFGLAKLMIGQQLNQATGQMLLHELRRLGEIFLVQINLGNQGNPDRDGDACGKNPFRILKDGFISLTGKLPVGFAIHMLDIKEDMINASHQVTALVPFEEATAFYPDRNAKPFAASHQATQKLVLNKRFATRKSHSATRVPKENLVAADLIQNGVGILRITGELQGFLRASSNALATEGATGRIKILRCRIQSLRTDRLASVAAFAFVGVVGELFVLCPALRIGAPLAPKAASGQKDRRANPVSIMDGIILHLQDYSRSSRFTLINNCHEQTVR